MAEKVAQKEINVVRSIFLKVFELLHNEYGELGWWPADSPYEVMLGAILTQNTNWKNVEQAITNLRKANCLTPEAIDLILTEELATLIRPSGYFNVKADRIKNFNVWYLANGQYSELVKLDTEELRNELLGIKGVGYETADDILLYAFERPVFVIDAYYRRVFSRIGIVDKDSCYEQLRHHIESHIDSDIKLYNQFHALLVEHCKNVCRVKPLCNGCVLKHADICSYSL